MALTALERFCNTAVVVFGCLLIFFLPISIAFVSSFAGGIIFFYLLKKISMGMKDRQAFKPRDILAPGPLALYVLFVAFGIFFSYYVQMSIVAFFAKFLSVILVFCACAECFNARLHARWFILIFACSVILICVSGLVQHVTGDDFLRGVHTEGGRVSSSFKQANDFGAYLLVVLSILFSWFLFHLRQKLPAAQMALFTLVLLLSVVCMGFTYSRSAWLGFFIALFLLGLSSKKIWVGVLVTALFLAVFTPLMKVSRDVSFLSDNVHQDSKAAHLHVQKKPFISLPNIEEFGGMGRLTFWREACHVISMAPLVGTGLNTYSKVAPIYKISWGGYPHNCYLQMAAEIGIPGLGAFLIFLSIFMWRALQACKHMKDVFLKSIAIGLWVGLTGFFIQSAFDTMFYSVQLSHFMWLMMGILAAVIAIDRRESAKLTNLKVGV